MSINLEEMRKLAGDVSESRADLSWGDQKVYDKVKKALGKEKVPLSKLADVTREVVKRRRDLFDAWKIAKQFIDEKGDHFKAFEKHWKKADKAQGEWEKEASTKAEPAIHKHMDNAIAALEKAEAEMDAATKLARKSRHRLYSGGIPKLKGFLSKPVSGLKQLKKGEALGMYYSSDW
jgi:hypothetical protein